MSLRRKVFVVLGATVLILLATLQIVARLVVADSFEKVEHDLIERDLSRIRDALQWRIADVENKGLDWSRWDDFWEYVAKPNQSFVESNLQNSSAQTLKIDMIIVFGMKGEVMNCTMIDRGSGKGVKPHPRLFESLAAGNLGGKGIPVSKVTSGVLLAGNDPLIVTSQPIVRSDATGPARGTVVMGRWLDEGEIAEIGKLTHLRLVASRYGLPAMPAELDSTGRAELLRELSVGQGMTHRDINPKQTRGLVRIDAVDGKPAGIISMTEARRVNTQGLLTLSLLASAILLSVLALAVVVWFTIERTVLRRLGLLSRQVAGIGLDGQGGHRVEEGAPDELGKLARSINQMVGLQERSRQAIEESAEEISEGQERFGLAIRGTHATVWEWNVVSDEMSWFGMDLLLDYTSADMPHTREEFFTRLHPESVELLRTTVRSHMAHQSDLVCEVRVKDAGGAYRWLEVGGQAVWDDEGNPIRVVGTAVDIERRKLAELELGKFYLVIEKSLDFIAMASLDGQIFYVNHFGKRMLGIPEDEDVCTKRIPDFYPEDLRSYLDDVLLPRTLESGSWEGEIRFAHMAGGDDLLMHEVVFTVNDPITGEPICYATVARDITAEKRSARVLAQARDEALASTRAKAAFLANMSHEIRTPMNGVIGMTELLMDTKLTDEQRDFAAIIQSSAESLLAVINDILDFTKIEAGKMEIDHVDFNLRTVLEEVSFLLAAKTHAKNLELICRIPPQLPEELVGDPTRVRQIVMNLLGNATKFTEEGEILLETTVLAESLTDVHVRISVKDTGIGIPEERQSEIFESFTQADDSASRRYCGTGLGLTICKQLAELMGGSIGVESVLGQGSKFWFDVRFQKQPVSSKAKVSEDLFKDLRALIVDDNPTNRLILREYLKAWGCESEEAESGMQALELLRGATGDSRFDVVLLDMQMPDMDGEDTARAIRGNAPSTDVGIILLTSMGLVSSTLDGLDRGFDATLVKPVHQSQLFNALATYLDRNTVSPPTEPKPAKQACAPLRGKRLLLVEDNAVNRKVATRILARYGCTPDIAENGIQALEALTKGDYDLVLMDCQMPEMDGFEATREIRRREMGSRKRQPIVAMTAGALEGDRERCLASGMDGYVAKPVKPQELLDAVLPWVGDMVRSKPVGELGVAMEVLDRQRLYDVCGDDQDFIGEVVTEFLNGVDGQLDAIRSAVESRDCTALASSAHALKGASRTIGGIAAAAVCEELEICARQGVKAGLSEIMERATNEFQKLKTALRSLVDSEAA